MCRVISVCNQKGGVSKSTTVLNLGIGLAREGKKVLIIDNDPQGSLTASLGYGEPDDIPVTLATIMTAVINEEEIQPEDGILHHEEGVDLLPGNIDLSALEMSIANVISREVILKEYIDMMDEMKAYEAIIKENISFEDLLVSHPLEKETIEGIMQLILETVLNKNKTMVIASNTYPTALVKSKFLKLDYYHIEYVLGCLSNNTSKVKNIKKYLLAALFNAPSTMDSYYRAEVNHDMPYMTMVR